MKKILTLATTLALLLTFSLPVLANDGAANAASNRAKTQQSFPADSATKAQEHLENQANKLANRQQYQQDLEPVRTLQKQETQIRQQIQSLRNQVHKQIKTARQAKNYTALSAALADMIPLQDDLAKVAAATKTCLTDRQQYYTNRQAQNDSDVTADLKQLRSDIQAKIAAMQNIITDLQKISQDLNTPAAAPAKSSSSAASNQTADSIM